MSQGNSSVDVGKVLEFGYARHAKALQEVSAYIILCGQTWAVVSKKKQLPPITIPLGLVDGTERSPKEVIGKHYTAISSKYALLAALSSSEEFMFYPYFCIQLAEAFQSRGRLKASEIREIQMTCVEESHAKNIWWPFYKKATKLGARFTLSEHYISLVGLRNILAHRSGRISPFDVDKLGQKKFSWQRMNMYLGGKKINKLPYHAKEGGRLTYKKRIISRTYRAGDEVKLNPKDISDILITLTNFSAEVKLVTANLILGILK